MGQTKEEAMATHTKLVKFVNVCRKIKRHPRYKRALTESDEGETVAVVTQSVSTGS